jgi:transcriptional regulator with XRE-family HTH domain
MATAAASFGARLRELRLARGFTQQALADRAGVSVNAVGAWERGLRFPRAAAVDALARALGSMPEELLHDLVDLRERPATPYGVGRGSAVALAELHDLLAGKPERAIRLVRDLALRILPEMRPEEAAQDPKSKPVSRREV